MLKVLNIRWGENVGGVESLLKYVARYSDRSSFDMRFCFLKTGAAHEEYIRGEGRQVAVLPAKSGYDLTTRLQLYRYVRAQSADIIVDHGMPPLLRPAIRLAASCPLVAYDHGCYETFKLKGKSLCNFLIKNEYLYCCDRIMTNSNYNKSIISKHYKVDDAKIDVVYPGVDTDLFTYAPLPTERLIIGYVGRIQFSDKGADYLVPLAKELMKVYPRSFEVRIYGEGIDKDSLKQMIRNDSLENYFKFCGASDKVHEELRLLNILVVPSRSEAFGLAALEGLSSGCRVACFDIGGLREAIGGSEYAVLVKPFDVVSMAREVARLALLPPCPPLGHQYVVDTYSAPVFVKNFEAALSRLQA